jgi:hypothetical protein
MNQRDKIFDHAYDEEIDMAEAKDRESVKLLPVPASSRRQS